MSLPASVLVVGASAGGLSTTEALRRKGFDGRITLLGGERHLPYDRPPLSKQVLSGAWEPDRAQLRPEPVLQALDAEFVLGDPAAGLDAASRTVRTASGRLLEADAIVIATGVRARTLPGQGELAGVHTVRTLDDAVALRAELAASRRLVVVGDGVLGAEVAATGRGLGLDVTLAGPQSVPMESQFGPWAGGLLGEFHAEHGVGLRLGTGVSGLVAESGRVSGVRLETGQELPADVVVVAIGGVPATDWLAGSGLTCENGVVCDDRCRAADGIWAVGDVARWHHRGLDAPLRLENRTNATQQGLAVASNILGADAPYSPVPYFWTDQYDAKVMVHGVVPAGAEAEVVDGDVASRRFVALFRSHGVARGVLGWNMPKQTRLHRREVADVLTPATV
ncbi:NAD(P)/FAD-dependent oxidoreductase [Myceligenerans indicum]|uniref:FAD-dependent oxidoreductase n=1 Tax=Myceligenerans indicum TaxID=2593663 RepID=A0ABS1LKA7_9MICO|nr:FAD-dependent oxidoreductase [Myceligenerans indicum]MBL0886543.1 FAD-dependent oxidoreductase [Myceligenerans indicum]